MTRKNSAKAMFASTFSSLKSAIWGPKSTLPYATMSAIAIVIGFGAVVFATVRYGPDCRPPQRSIAIGSVVLVAGCLQQRTPTGGGS